ncbi:MAG TPA: hypothetical protein VGB04_01040 [Allosphingosinicella sp.]|jgi:hypothetical protein
MADAAAILPPARIVRHRGGSPSLFSNLFRYELQRRGLGTWMDSEVYLLAPIDGRSDYLLGYGAPGVINGALLRLPPDSPMLPPLIALFGEREVPPWLPWRARLAARLRLALRGRSGLADMPWGSAGPRALSWLASLRLHGRRCPPSRYRRRDYSKEQTAAISRPSPCRRDR